MGRQALDAGQPAIIGFRRGRCTHAGGAATGRRARAGLWQKIGRNRSYGERCKLSIGE